MEEPGGKGWRGRSWDSRGHQPARRHSDTTRGPRVRHGSHLLLRQAVGHWGQDGLRVPAVHVDEQALLLLPARAAV